MTTLLLALLLLCQTPAPDLTANTLYCNQIQIGATRDRHCVLSPISAIWYRENGVSWCELSMENANDYPQLRIRSEYLPQYTIVICCDPAGPIVRLETFDGTNTKTTTIYAATQQTLTVTSPGAPAASPPASIYGPPMKPPVLAEPWQ